MAGEMSQMGGTDWAGLGLQLAGGIMSEADKKKQEEEDLRRFNIGRSDVAFNRMQDARARMEDARRYEDSLRLKNRDQNQQGLGYLTGLVSGNQQAGRRISFRDALFQGVQ